MFLTFFLKKGVGFELFRLDTNYEKRKFYIPPPPPRHLQWTVPSFAIWGNPRDFNVLIGFMDNFKHMQLLFEIKP